MRVFAVVALIAPVALAGDAAHYALNLKALIDKNWSKAKDPHLWLHAEAYEALCKSPKHTAVVCAAAAKQVARLYVRQEPWEMLVAFLMRTTKCCLARAPKDPDAIRAAADAHMTRARLAVELEQPPKAKDWAAAVDLLQRVHGVRPDGGKPLIEAVRILLDQHRDQARLARVCAIGKVTYPEEHIFRVPDMRARLDAAKDDRALRELLDDWKPLGETYRDAMLALYNEAVTVAKRRKLKTKHDWLSHTDRRYTHGIMFDIPWHRWVGYGDLKQYDRDGMLRTTITFMLERGELTTSLVKAEAKRLQREIGGKITLKPGRHRLNRHFKRCFMYAMGGLDKQGDFVHYRVLLLRAGAELARIEIRSRTAETDPEVEQILATLRPYSLKRGK